MTDDNTVICELVRRIERLERQLAELQRHQVAWRVRGIPAQGVYPRRHPDWPGLRISQPLETR